MTDTLIADADGIYHPGLLNEDVSKSVEFRRRPSDH
jgi:hypothetical protein